MITLSIDTAANFCAVALSDTCSGELLVAVTHDIGRGHAEILMTVIDEAMNQAELEYQDVDKIVTTIGPGSFTGVRVGISTARAIALGLSRPVVGVSVLEACAQYAMQVDKAQIYETISKDRLISVILDARREEFYFQAFRNGKPLLDANISKIEQLVKFHEEFGEKDVVLCGSGASKFLEQSTGLKSAVNYSIAHNLAAAPIEIVAELGIRLSAGEGRPEPLYLRGADAKQQQGFAILRAETQDIITAS